MNYMAFLLKSYFDSYRGLPIACWQGILLLFVVSIAIGVSFFISLYFVNVLHINLVESGWLLSAYGGGSVLGGMLGGKFVDKFSPKLISLISLMALALSFLLLVKLTALKFLLINLFIMGAAIFSFVTANDVWVLGQCQNEEMRLKVINVSRIGLNLGLGISGAIMGLFAEHGFQEIFYAFSGVLFLLILYYMFQAESKMVVQTSTPKVTINESLQNRKVIILMLFCLFSVGLLIAQLGTTYPVYVQKNFGMHAISILFILDTIIIVLLQAPLVRLLQAANKVLIAGIGAFLMGLGLFFLTLSYSFNLAVFSCVVWTTGEMLFVPMAQAVCYERSHENKKGRMMGAYQTVYASSKLIGPIAGGVVFEYFGGNVLWYACAIICVICLAGCLHFKKYA